MVFMMLSKTYSRVNIAGMSIDCPHVHEQRYSSGVIHSATTWACVKLMSCTMLY